MRGFQSALLEGLVKCCWSVLTVGVRRCTQGDGRVIRALLITAGFALARIRRADKGEMGREQRANHWKDAFNELVLNKTDTKPWGKIGEKKIVFEQSIFFAGLILLHGFATNIPVPPAFYRTLVCP